MEIWKYGNVEISKYRKHERRTMLGKQCQIWDADYPWQNKFNDEPKHMYDNQLTEDLCRNAYIEGDVDPEDGVWCYTLDEEQRWDYCPVRRCLDCDTG